MSMSEDERKALEQTLNTSWPEIQKHLIEEGAKESGREGDPYEPYWTTNEDGTRVLHMSSDSWWLREFRREDVIITLPGVCVMNTQHWHVDAAAQTLREAYGLRRFEDCDDCFTQDDILAHIERFPEGQFVAIRISGMGAGHAIAMAVTLRASRSPLAPVMSWHEAIGDMRLSAHEDAGDWLYGVEMAVRPIYRRRGIGTAMYEARKRLVASLNLRGWYFVGMLMGYRDHSDTLSALEYGERVIAGELTDPTVTMQMNRGFRPIRVIRDYVEEEAAGNAGVLLVWENSDYDPARAT